MSTTGLSAYTLQAILSHFTEDGTTMFFERKKVVEPLYNKIVEALGDKKGAQQCILKFTEDEIELRKQFVDVCAAIEESFGELVEIQRLHLKLESK
jgi:hypothetical protein